MRSLLTLTILAACAIAALAADEAQPMTPETARLLQAADEPVRVVCFGDSITGVYYHTGGVRAYPEMLEIALKMVHPDAPVKVINAGISGHTTENALARIQKDVLAHKPHLVTVSFGMNDITRVSAEDFAANLANIVSQCRAIGAEVMLCTPNSIYPGDGGRPIPKLASYAQIVRDIGAQTATPVADFYQAYEDLRAKDVRAWMLLMSETIHPGMHGHKLFAELLAKGITGQTVSLRDVPPPSPSVVHTLARLREGLPVSVIAMPPYDGMIEGVLKDLYPDAQVNVTSWPLEGQSLGQIEAWAKGIREKTPDLVIVAIPADRNAATEEAFIRSYSWVLNWSLSFGKKVWDCIGVLPSVAAPELSDEESEREDLATEMIRGIDIGMVTRPEGSDASAREILAAWLKADADCMPH